MTHAPDTVPADEFATPPESFDEGPAPSRWPLAIGVIGIVYALLGMLLYLCGSAGAVFSPWLMRTFMGEAAADLEMNPAILVSNLVQSVVMLALGVILLVGSIRLVKRRRSGASLVRFWVVARLVIVLPALAVAWFTMPMQHAFQKDVIEIQRDMIRSSRSDLSMRELDEMLPVPELEDTQRNFLVFGLPITAVTLVTPIAFGFLLSSEERKAEMERWPA